MVVHAREAPAGTDLGLRTTYTWTVADQMLVLSLVVMPEGTWPVPLPRLGLRLAVPARLGKIEWFGRGPGEAYPDTRQAARVGRFTSTVEDLQTPYVMPQAISYTHLDVYKRQARLDGVGEFRIFLMMATALMKPALVTIFLFQFVVIWNNFFLPLIMLVDRKLFPMTLGLYSWNSQTQQDPTLATAVLTGALLSVVPIIAAFLMLQRYWRGGLGAGGVKG